MKESTPYINEEMIKAVSISLRNLNLSKFVGSPHDNVYRLLGVTSDKLTQNCFSEKTFFGGRSIRELERDWANLMNVKYCISVNSATSGLITAINALGDKGFGNKIITTPFSFTASASAVSLANCIPIFADIDLDTFCLSPKFVEELICKSGIKAILYVSWCGNAGHWNSLKHASCSIPIIEDASQSIGNKYKERYIGTLGDIGVFSLNEPKNIQAGEGGMIVTNNTNYAVRSRLIRNHGENIVREGEEDEWLQDIIGYNFRLTEIQADIAKIQLRKLKDLNTFRLLNYLYIIDALKDYKDVLIPQKITNSEYYPYCMAFRWVGKNFSRDEVAQKFHERGVPVSTGMHRLLCDHPYYTSRGIKADVPNARLLNDQYLGFFQIGYPNKHNDMDNIIEIFKKIMKGKM